MNMKNVIRRVISSICSSRNIRERTDPATFIMDHPIEISPLTKKKPSDLNKVERFLSFSSTWKCVTHIPELNDPIDQRERFKAQDALFADAGDEEANHTDEDFLNALGDRCMPPTGGIDTESTVWLCCLQTAVQSGDVLRSRQRSHRALRTKQNNVAQAKTVSRKSQLRRLIFQR